MTASIERAARWLDRQVNDMNFGEAAVRVIVHQGKIRIEKMVTIKEAPEK